MNKEYYKNFPYGSELLVHCPKCQNNGQPNYKLRGYNWLNIVLLVIGIIPGVLYFIRRRINRICICEKCHHEELEEINEEAQLIEKLFEIQHEENTMFRMISIIPIVIIVCSLILYFHPPFFNLIF